MLNKNFYVNENSKTFFATRSTSTYTQTIGDKQLRKL